MPATFKTASGGRGRPAGDWWEISARWQAASAGLQHGQVESATDAFAAAEAVTPDTLRRYAAGRKLVEELVERYPGLMPGRLAQHRLTALASLQRMRRYGEEAMLESMQALLAREISHGQLLAAECDLRTEAGGKVSDAEPVNRHVYRLDQAAFRAAALKAFQLTLGDDRAVLTLPSVAGSIGPIFVDAIVRNSSGAARAAIRLVPALATAAGPERMRATCLMGLAGARVFADFVLLARRKEDAQALAALVRSTGSCGVSVWLFNDDCQIACLQPAVRTTGPDLACDEAWRERLGPAVPAGSDGASRSVGDEAETEGGTGYQLRLELFG